MTRQVTDRIEKKRDELESLDCTKSVTVAGETTVFVYLRDTTKAADVKPTWIRLRNMIADIKADFPQGVICPYCLMSPLRKRVWPSFIQSSWRRLRSL
ncbi:multidrug efflux pump subunit AcrB [Bradyrhizobium sp. LM6.10]